VAACQLLPRRLDHHGDALAVFLGELKVPLVVGRHRHHRAGAVAHEHKIGDENGHVPAGDRVGAIAAGEHPLLGDVLQRAPAFVHGPPVLHEAAHFRFLGGAPGQGQGPGVLRGQAHEGGPPQGVLAGGEHGEGLGLPLHRKMDVRAQGFADPVALHGDDPLRPVVQTVQVGQQFFGVGGDLEEPLLQLLQDHFAVAAPAGPSSTCSLASTVRHWGHQFTGDIFL
jgi:hypothetical protein